MKGKQRGSKGTDTHRGKREITLPPREKPI
jgi:hypothetical protein